MRYVRTGEWRAPKSGEIYEAGCSSNPTRCFSTTFSDPRWILREVPDGQVSEVPPAIATAINAVLDAKTLPEISDAVEALRRCWRPEV